MAELTDFLEAEVEFVERYREVLVDLKGDWDRSCVLRSSRSVLTRLCIEARWSRG